MSAPSLSWQEGVLGSSKDVKRIFFTGKQCTYFNCVKLNRISNSYEISIRGYDFFEIFIKVWCLVDTQAIFFGGIDEYLRAEVWPFLLHFYVYDSTTEERNALKGQKREEYTALNQKRYVEELMLYAYQLIYFIKKQNKNKKHRANACFESYWGSQFKWKSERWQQVINMKWAGMTLYLQNPHSLYSRILGGNALRAIHLENFTPSIVVSSFPHDQWSGFPIPSSHHWKNVWVYH